MSRSTASPRRLLCAVLLVAAVFAVSALDAGATNFPYRFGTGWTNIVQTGDSDSPFYTGYFDALGHWHQMSSTDLDAAGITIPGSVEPGSVIRPDTSRFWTKIVGSNDLHPASLSAPGKPVFSDLLFYDSVTGSARIARMQEGGVGQLALQPKVPAAYVFPTGFTHIVWTIRGLLFYNAQTGFTMTAKYDWHGTDNVGLFRWVESFWMPKGFTNVTAANGPQVLFYQRGTGVAAVGMIGDDGWYTPQRSYTATANGLFSPYWTNIVDTGPPSVGPYNRLLFYAAGTPTGAGYAGALGRLNPNDGTFTTESYPTLGQWTDVISWPDSMHVVFFYKGDTGQAATAKIFTDNAGRPNYTNVDSWN
jgi:hypothetical protein